MSIQPPDNKRESPNLPAEQLLKVTLDYVIVIPLLLYIWPLLLILGILIRLDSPGPIIARQSVIGKNGRLFTAFKFRTMYIHGDEILAKYPKLQAELKHNRHLKADPRVTRIGKWLRRFRLDELPQLFNVLRQEMSLIGPRPIPPSEISHYGKWGEALLSMRPGLTGLWFVSTHSNTPADERIQLDVYYVHHWSVWLDLQIFFRTPLVLLKEDRLIDL